MQAFHITFSIMKMKHRALCIIFIFVFILTGCKDLFVNDAPVDTNYADFEKVWNEVNNVYPMLKQKHINWDSMYTYYKPLAENAKGDEEFKIIFNMLLDLKDCHTTITNLKDQEIETYFPPRDLRDRLTYNPITISRYFKSELIITAGGIIIYGMLPDSIGYVRIGNFRGLNDFDEVLNYFKYTKALVIDVRNNPGGTVNSVEFIAGRFIDTTMQYMKFYSKVNYPQMPPLIPRGQFIYKKPVALLINGASCSAAEHFAEIMKQIPSVTAIGDTTEGGGGDAGYKFTLPCGRVVQISDVDYFRYDGVPIEWNGVTPDITVLLTKEEVDNGHDLQLERAIKLLEDKSN